MESKISIIVPMYNCEKYIEKCIRSICEQTYTNIEIVIVDDGSIDGSLSICKQMSKSDNRIKIFAIPNSGVANARNYGIDNSSGDYIMFVDCDDYIEKNMCESLMESIKTQHVDVVVSNLLEEDIYGNILRKPIVKEPGIILFDEKFDFMADYACFVVAGNLYNRNVIEGVRFDSRFFVGEDSLFFYTVISKCRKYYITDELFYHYVNYPESASHGIVDNKKYTALLACKEIGKLIPDSNCEQYKTLCAVIEYRARFLYRKSYNSKMSQINKKELLKLIDEYGKIGKKHVKLKGKIERMLIKVLKWEYPRVASILVRKKC